MGGIETQVSGLVSYQTTHGEEVFVLTLTPGEDFSGVHRFVFKLPGNFLWHPRGKSLIRKALQELKPDVVHLHFGAVSPFAWDGMRTVRELNIPSVATVHSIWGTFARKMYALTARNLHSKTIFSSVSRIASSIVQESLHREVSIAHNGVDIDFWKSTISSESEKIEIVSATRFASRKRIRAQILVIEQVVKNLAENSPHFTIAGTGPDFKNVELLIKKKNLQKYITLTGRLDRFQLRDLYAKSDLFLQMSILEAFGIAACEARAAGLPVLTRQGSGVEEFVDSGKTGFLEPSDGEVVLRIMQLASDRNLLRMLKTSSKDFPPIQTWDHAANQVAKLYQQAIS